MEAYSFRETVRRWRNSVRGRSYSRYVINVPREIGERIAGHRVTVIIIVDGDCDD